MTEDSISRETILSRIRSSQTAADRRLTVENYASISRGYRRRGLLNADQRLKMFEERLVEYDAHVERTSPSDLRESIAAALIRRRCRRVAIPGGIAIDWIPASVQVVEADSLSNIELDQLDGLISGCSLGIALTGTIVLQNALGQGPRKLSLIPDYHLCVVFAEQVVETVPEAFDRLAPTAMLPTTFISGPSATADIEMTRIKGVHGPRFLEVLLVC